MVAMACRYLVAISVGIAAVVGGVFEPAYAGTSISIQIGDDASRDAPKKAAKHGPPDHAPAHGYRAKHQYRYYPDSEVYFDTGARMYFYLSSGAWKASVSLPLNLKLALGDSVSIEMDGDTPYTEHAKHKKSYPPGQAKKHDKGGAHENGGKGKDMGKGGAPSSRGGQG